MKIIYQNREVCDVTCGLYKNIHRSIVQYQNDTVYFCHIYAALLPLVVSPFPMEMACDLPKKHKNGLRTISAVNLDWKWPKIIHFTYSHAKIEYKWMKISSHISDYVFTTPINRKDWFYSKWYAWLFMGY